MSAQLLTDNEVLAQVRGLATRNKVGWTYHALERMAQRGFDKSQVKECLMRGAFTENPTNPNKSGDIEYAFRISANVDGDPISVAASLCPDSKVVVITVIDD